MKTILLVGLGGFFGSIARYYTQFLFNKLFFNPFPLGTLMANVSGCFIIGVVVALGLRHGGFTEAWKLFLAVGFCGGFTTFSSFSLENINLMQSGQYVLAFSYIFGSVIMGLLATLIAIFLFR